MAREMVAANVSVGVFPEQALGGYPAEDLVQWRGFVAAQGEALLRFAAETASSGTVFVLGVVVAVRGHLYNVAAVVHRGRVVGVVPKEKLPTYNVFYEARTFTRGPPGHVDEHAGVPFGDLVFTFDFGMLAVELCEDVWSPDGPMRRRCYAGAELVVNISASPYRMGVLGTRREMLATRSADNQCTLAYVTAVGANDGLIFDGGGFVFQNGRPVLEAPRWREGWAPVTVDLDRTTRLRTENTTWRGDSLDAHASLARPTVVKAPGVTADRSTLLYPAPAHGSFFLPAPALPRTAREELCDDLLDALALGVGDYFEKTRAFKGFGIALSGGRDSLLTLLVAWRYVQRRFVDLDEGARRAKTGERLLHALALLLGSHKHLCEDDLRGARGAPPGRADRGGVQPRGRGCAHDGGRRTHGHHGAERAGPRALTSHVELGEHERDALPPDGQHEREGDGLHHHRG
jgi:NAD+ synthase (glutamine-hydrolysing)